MIKKTENGLYFSTLDPKTFKTFSEAVTHEEYTKITREATRPDSRDDVQKMNDAAFKVPLSIQPEKYAGLEASIRGAKNKIEADIYRPGLSPREVMLAALKAHRFQGQEVAEATAEASEWAERPLIKSGLIEAKRLLAEAENDFTRDRSEVVKAEQLVAALSIVGADEGWIRSQLKSLLAVEEARKLAVRETATAELAAAQAKVDALGSAQTVTVRVPVEGDDLLSKGNSYTSNLLASGAPPEQLAAAFAAMDAAFLGDTAALEATLEANGGA
ncbi:MAG: hypothetical protein C0485_01830 [Pirellula sp.]|nr:hypothetical protein [Pirellula sp.]